MLKFDLGHREEVVRCDIMRIGKQTPLQLSLSRDCACWHQAMDLLEKDIMVCLVLIRGPRR
uniref:Uncharacterized protein n=1 Tax=Triticum urartu TaxID=4572 RepID=A0A8R7QU42_TRIUA